MEINEGINYSVICDDINNDIVNIFHEYYIVKMDYSFDEIIQLLSDFKQKRIVFLDVLRNYSIQEKNKILDLLNLRKINFINITSNMEEVLYTPYLYVYSNNEIVLKGNTIDVLQNEKELKGIGFVLPFAVDLSLQLKLYGTIDHIEQDIGKLVETLWT